MRTIEKKIRFIVSLIVVALFVSLAKGESVKATQVNEIPIISLVKYEVTNNKIIPGEDFTLTLELKNNSETTSATNLLVDVDNPNGVAPIYGTVSQIFIDEIKPGEVKRLSFDYNSVTSITSEILEFHVTAVGQIRNNYIILRIPTGSDIPFSIVSTNVPNSIGKGSMTTATATFMVLGKNNVRNVSLALLVNGTEVKRSVVGILTPGTTRTQGVPFAIGELGEYNLQLVLHYEDAAGIEQSIDISTGDVAVLETVGESNQGQQQNDNNGESNEQKIMMLGIMGITVLLLFLGITIWVRKKR